MYLFCFTIIGGAKLVAVLDDETGAGFLGDNDGAEIDVERGLIFVGGRNNDGIKIDVEIGLIFVGGRNNDGTKLVEVLET